MSSLVWLSVWSLLWNFLSFPWFLAFPAIPWNRPGPFFSKKVIRTNTVVFLFRFKVIADQQIGFLTLVFFAFKWFARSCVAFPECLLIRNGLFQHHTASYNLTSWSWNLFLVLFHLILLYHLFSKGRISNQ